MIENYVTTDILKQQNGVAKCISIIKKPEYTASAEKIIEQYFILPYMLDPEDHKLEARFKKSFKTKYDANIATLNVLLYKIYKTISDSPLNTFEKRVSAIPQKILEKSHKTRGGMICLTSMIGSKKIDKKYVIKRDIPSETKTHIENLSKNDIIILFYEQQIIPLPSASFFEQIAKRAATYEGFINNHYFKEEYCVIKD